METFTPEKFASCEHVLRQLKRLDIPTRQSIRSISLTRDSTCSEDHGNSIGNALRLAIFLLAWKELEVITLPMPDDKMASDFAGRDYNPWSWVLHRPLLNAFARGRYRELRLLHPHRYGDVDVFLYHNLCCYVEPWVLPLETRKDLKRARESYWEDCWTLKLDYGQEPDLQFCNETQRRVIVSLLGEMGFARDYLSARGARSQ